MGRSGWILVVLVSAAAAGCGSPEEPQGDHPKSRGEYLVENVAMCGDCHTPRLPDGSIDRANRLQGARIDFRPLHPVPNWADEAPALAGLPKMGDAAVVKLLETGLMPDGKRSRPPMPQYRMSRVDAVDVAEYLRSLRQR